MELIGKHDRALLDNNPACSLLTINTAIRHRKKRLKRNARNRVLLELHENGRKTNAGQQLWESSYSDL